MINFDLENFKDYFSEIIFEFSSSGYKRTFLVENLEHQTILFETPIFVLYNQYIRLIKKTDRIVPNFNIIFCNTSNTLGHFNQPCRYSHLTYEFADFNVK